MTDIPTFKEFALFCETPKTRKEIRENFQLSQTESWHLVKRFSKFTSDIITSIDRHRPGNTRVFQTRKATLERYKNE